MDKKSRFGAEASFDLGDELELNQQLKIEPNQTERLDLAFYQSHCSLTNRIKCYEYETTS